jgi:hypothetical protein
VNKPRKRRAQDVLDPLLEQGQTDIIGDNQKFRDQGGPIDPSEISNWAKGDGLPTSAREQVPLGQRNLTWNSLYNQIKNNEFVYTTDLAYQVGYLAQVQKDGLPPEIIQEVFLLPSSTSAVFRRRPKDPGANLIGTYNLLSRTEVISNEIANLTDDRIRSLKLEMYRKGLYKSPNDADMSLRMGSIPDEAFKVGLANIYRDTSLENFRRAKLGRKNLFDIDDYLTRIPESPTSTTQVVTSVPSPGDADTILRRQYQDYVGRAPNKKEFEAFRNSVRSAASSRPTVTTTTMGEPILGEGVADASAFRQEGFSGGDLSEMALAEARKNPESAPYQKATKYFDTFLSALPPATGLEVGGADLEQLLASGGAG